ncbi:hypothetical protein, partial [Hafnia paralvei]|uniref:hypothetical protein n=1 Tax=Hafnia paralvei TaxID=546367 RepID=UPI00266D6CC4
SRELTNSPLSFPPRFKLFTTCHDYLHPIVGAGSSTPCSSCVSVSKASARQESTRSTIPS